MKPIFPKDLDHLVSDFATAVTMTGCETPYVRAATDDDYLIAHQRAQAQENAQAEKEGREPETLVYTGPVPVAYASLCEYRWLLTAELVEDVLTHRAPAPLASALALLVD